MHYYIVSHIFKLGTYHSGVVVSISVAAHGETSMTRLYIGWRTVQEEGEGEVGDVEGESRDEGGEREREEKEK